MQYTAFALAAMMAPLALAAPTPDTAPNTTPDTSILPLPAGVTEAPAPAGAVVGNAIVVNNCGFDINLRSVGSVVGGEHTLGQGGSYSEQFHLSGSGAGISIKMDKSPADPVSGGPIAQFEYTLAGSEVYYDLSLINGDPFSADLQVLRPAIASCPTVTCPANQVPCQEAYTSPDQPATKACASSGNLVFSVC